MCCIAEMSPFWTEFYTPIGFWVGVVGFAFTIWQVMLAKREAKAAHTSADAAREAIRETTHENRRNFHRFMAGSVLRLMTEAQRWAENKEWSLAAERTNDLIEQVAQFTGDDSELLRIVEVLRTSRLVMLTKRQGAGQKFPMEEFQQHSEGCSRKYTVSATHSRRRNDQNDP